LLQEINALAGSANRRIKEYSDDVLFAPTKTRIKKVYQKKTVQTVGGKTIEVIETVNEYETVPEDEEKVARGYNWIVENSLIHRKLHKWAFLKARQELVAFEHAQPEPPAQEVQE
jgi:hypothetical protein